MRGFVLIVLLTVAGVGEARAQDAAAGEKVFGVCKACHQIGETAKNGVGPVLNGVIGRKAGSVPGYSYSAANKDSGITWDEATFREYIKDPKAKVPGTKMIYAGPERRAEDQRPRHIFETIRCRREKEVRASGRRRRPLCSLVVG